ncbi:MAG: relaxase/mobilization nuclease domain-containing protein [Oscillospiraceae bacterium]|jgi:hypothetical protein|nr:relaxase/mobilization nuclease domain-containing protein [Oscillospiraceae bacterium]
MAVIKTANTTEKYHNLNSYSDVINYITQPSKTIHGYIGSIILDPYNPAEDMEAVAKKFHKESGVHVRHFIVAFDPLEPVTPGIAVLIGQEIIGYLGKQFQAIYAVHEDKPQLHIHIIINAVSHVDGHKYRGTREVFHRFEDFVRRTVRKYGVRELHYVSSRAKHCFDD